MTVNAGRVLGVCTSVKYIVDGIEICVAVCGIGGLAPSENIRRVEGIGDQHGQPAVKQTKNPGPDGYLPKTPNAEKHETCGYSQDNDEQQRQVMPDVFV